MSKPRTRVHNVLLAVNEAAAMQREVFVKRLKLRSNVFESKIYFVRTEPM